MQELKCQFDNELQVQLAKHEEEKKMREEHIYENVKLIEKVNFALFCDFDYLNFVFISFKNLL